MGSMTLLPVFEAGLEPKQLGRSYSDLRDGRLEG